MGNNESCIFCKIVAGVIPCHKVYEDKNVLAFLDIHPVSKGHMLVIPKQHFETIDVLPKETYSQVMDVTYELSQKVKQIFEPQKVGRAVIGIDVPHAHQHIVPIYEGDEIHMEQDLDAEPDHTGLTVVANKLGGTDSD